MKKRIVSCVLCILLLAAVWPTAAFPAAAEKSGDYTYETFSDGTAYITAYSGVGGNVVIPSTLDGCE